MSVVYSIIKYAGPLGRRGRTITANAMIYLFHTNPWVPEIYTISKRLGDVVKIKLDDPAERVCVCEIYLCIYAVCICCVRSHRARWESK